MRAVTPTLGREVPIALPSQESARIALRHPLPRAPEYVGAEQTEDRLLIVGVERRQINRRRKSELRQQRQRADVEIVHAVVERQGDTSRRECTLVQPTDGLVQ